MYIPSVNFTTDFDQQERISAIFPLRETVFNRLLPFVGKPGRYIGNEINITRKALEEVDVRVALVFPDVYEIGMSYLGFSILYHILNQQPGVFAERAFAPWPDMEAQMRAERVPLFSLETFSPLGDFDVIGVTLQYELHYPTLLNLLDLAGVPMQAQRREGLPLVIGGGPSAFNPEPIADFMDAVLLGDGEEATLEIVEVVRAAKRRHLSRLQTLQALAQIEGVYVPQFYQPRYDKDGSFVALEPTDAATPRRIRTRTVSALKSEFYPDKPLVPVIQATHERVSLEIARGCSRGCRFCNAGMIYRPVRQRTPEELAAQARSAIDATGFEEVSLLSLSTSDYTRLPELMRRLSETFRGEKVNISFPSLRPESFTPLTAHYAKGVRKSGLTLAPEAGSQRLRDVINKATAEGELLRAVDLAFREGWNTVKLYFMIGHPTETDDDLQGLVDLVDQVRRIASRHHGRINVSISPFIPKAVTPFQWAAQDGMAETQRKLDFLLEKMRWRNVKISRRDAETALVEGLFARGDRRVGRVIERVRQLGARLEGWSELFDFERYRTALQECGLTFEQFLQEKALESALPWDHIDKGVTKKFLRDEYRRALGQEQTPDCRFSECNACGLMGQQVCRELIAAQRDGKSFELPIEFAWQQPMPEEIEPPKPPAKTLRFARMHYRRGQEVCWLSHLDLVRLIERALRRARVPVAFSEGFNPHPKLAFGPPLATGLTSDAEYLDLQFYGDDIDVAALLTPQLPAGISICQVKYSAKRMTAPSAVINRAEYEFRLNEQTDELNVRDRIEAVLKAKELNVERKKEGSSRCLDVRPFILDIEANGPRLLVQTVIDGGKSVRIDELCFLLFPDQELWAKTCSVHRRALWIFDGTRLTDPMEALFR